MKTHKNNNKPVSYLDETFKYGTKKVDDDKLEKHHERMEQSFLRETLSSKKRQAEDAGKLASLIF